MTQRVQGSRYHLGLIGEYSLRDPGFEFSDEIVPIQDLSRYLPGRPIEGLTEAFSNFTVSAPGSANVVQRDVPNGRCVLITGGFCEGRIQTAAANILLIRFIIQGALGTGNLALFQGRSLDNQAVGTSIVVDDRGRLWVPENRRIVINVDITGALSQITGSAGLIMYEFPMNVWAHV